MAFSYFAPTESLVLGERTYLTVAVATSGTALTVKNNTQFGATDYILLGELGAEDSELVTASALTGSTGITVGAVKFAHAINCAVYQIRFNQRKLYGATVAGGTYVTITTSALGVDAPAGTFFSYTGSTYTAFKVTYLNAATSVEYPAVADAVEMSATDKKFYTTLSAYKQYAGIADDTRDGEIAALLRVYTDAINSYLFGDVQQSLWSQSYTESTTVGNPSDRSFFAGTDGDILILKHAPITAVTSITLDGNVVYSNSVSLISIDGYEGYQIYLDDILPGGGRTRRLPITVVYTAGYSALPGDIELAMWKLLGQSLNRDLRDNAGVSSYSIGSKRVDFDLGAQRLGEGALPPVVTTLLAPYKRTRIYTYP